jgi:hypothetical protein
MRFHASIGLLLFAGCVGSSASVDDAGSQTPSSDATSQSDAGGLSANDPFDASPAGDASDAPSSDADAAFSVFSPDGRVPQNHRASGSACPPRGPGTSCSDAGVPLAGRPCVVDSDCTMGENGRCFVYPSIVPPEGGTGQGTLYCGSFCSYDQCQSDSDCAARVPCECDAPNVAGSPNMCLTQSNCAVDSDCGPGGFCSSSGAEAEAGQPDLAYYCHTLRDSCFDDSDCPPPPYPGYGACTYDLSIGSWDCHFVPTIQ